MAALAQPRPRGGADEERELDLEALVSEFLADGSLTELELPHMTTGQRKRAKRLAEQHPGLRCESFGLGQERRLHLFKPSHEASTEKAPTEACSTGASTPGTPSSSSRGSGGQLRHPRLGSPSGLATPLGVAAVRNTFIHFEGAKEDDRLVQSLPHGMFRQQLQAEAFGEAEQLSPDTTEQQPEQATDQLELPTAAALDVMLPPGVEVEIGGLSKLPAFNGRRGVVRSYDPEAGRYDVALWSETGEQRAKVRRENLTPVAPLSPRHSAAAALASPVAVPLSPQAFCCAAAAGGLFLATRGPGQVLQAR